MEGHIGILILALMILLLFNNKSIEKFMPYDRNHILGPSVVGSHTTDINNNLNTYPHDPWINTESYSRMIMNSLDNNMINNFTEYNIKKSLAFACIKQILYDTLLKLNADNIPMKFKTIGSKIVNDSKKNKLKIIINKIITAIKSTVNNDFIIELDDDEKFKVFKEINTNTYLVDYSNNIKIVHPDDEIYDKFIKGDKLFTDDIMTFKYPHSLRLVIQFIINLHEQDGHEVTIKPLPINDIKKIKNNINIYITSLSVINQ